MSEPGAVATGLKIQHLSPAKAGSGFLGDVIPGLRSLRSLTRGYNLSSLRDSLTQTSKLSLCLRHSFSRLDATQQIWTRAAGVRKSNDEGGTMNGNKRRFRFSVHHSSFISCFWVTSCLIFPSTRCRAASIEGELNGKVRFSPALIAGAPFVTLNTYDGNSL